MIQEVIVKGETIVLESDRLYSGGTDLSEDDKQARKALGLPMTKQLVYYKDKTDKQSIIFVTQYKIVEMYDITDKWYTLELALINNMTVRIHSSYFAEMQKSSFIEDMKKS
jgi:hypothetical protein